MTGHILAIGGLSPDFDDTKLHRLARDLTGRSNPSVCFLPTASGDNPRWVDAFYDQWPRGECRPSHLALFGALDRRPAEVIAEQDIIYVGGGSTPILLAALRVHGLDVALRDTHARGAVLCGDSAGALCWFTGGVTDALGPALQPLSDGLALLEASMCPHYDRADRRRVFGDAVVRTALPGGYGVEDGVALHFSGAELADVVRARPNGTAYRVERDNRAPESVVEHPLPVTQL